MHPSLAENILENAATPKDTHCQLCKHPQKRIRRAGLCNHCHRLKLELKACERDLANFTPRPENPKSSELHQYFLERKVKVARRMVELTKHEGESYFRFAHPVTGLELEHELSSISKRWVRMDLFHGWANILDWSFDPTQKRLLSYVLRKMIVEYLRANRRNIAEGNVFHKEREQGLA